MKYLSLQIVDFKKEALNIRLKVPFLRPKISGDRISDYPVLYDSLIKAEKFYSKKYDYIVMLQPTSPLRITQEFKEQLIKNL